MSSNHKHIAPYFVQWFIFILFLDKCVERYFLCEMGVILHFWTELMMSYWWEQILLIEILVWTCWFFWNNNNNKYIDKTSPFHSFKSKKSALLAGHTVLKKSLWFNILDFVWLNIGIDEQLNKKMIYFDSDTECMLEMCCTHRNVVLYLGQTAFQRANV